MRFDSATYDEPNHIARGFEFLRGETRLAPHNPPLSEFLFALGAELATHPVYPIDTVYLREITEDNSRGQGDLFLFASGNDADSVLFWARVPVIVLSIAVGTMIFLFAAPKFGTPTALIATVLYAFSPTIIAHSRYATTDIGATAGFLAGILSYLALLQRPSWTRTILAGIALGTALLMKYSTLLLLVLCPVFLIERLIVTSSGPHKRAKGEISRLIARTLAMEVIGLIVVWCVSACFLINFPIDEQITRTQILLKNCTAPGWFIHLVTLATGLPFIRPLGEYMLGIAIAYGIFAHGEAHYVYFMGTTSETVSHWYFPVLYLMKEPIAAHLLAIIAVIAGAGVILRTRRCGPLISSGWAQEHFAEIAMATFVAIYWLMALRSNLMIGLRHVLPTLPFIYILVARGMSAWIDSAPPQKNASSYDPRRPLQLAHSMRRVIVGALLAWIAAESILIYPHYLSYYNELAGGPWAGHWYASESNYDWGQDYRRFAGFVHKNKIDRISVAAFEAASLRYYLGDAFVPWKLSSGKPRGWFAISTTERDRALARYPGRNEPYPKRFNWLRYEAPIQRIGYTFWLYKFP